MDEYTFKQCKGCEIAEACHADKEAAPLFITPSCTDEKYDIEPNETSLFANLDMDIAIEHQQREREYHFA